jgi:hypothetical protein
MESDIKHGKILFNQANKASRDSFFSWIRIVISILTPSLVLLIGLQDKSQSLSCLSIYFLLASIIVMTVTILSGLFVLGSESKGYLLLRNKTADHVNNGNIAHDAEVNLPNIYRYASKAFSVSSYLSVLCLCLFGVFKYVT